MLSDAEYQLIMKESSGNPLAKNPHSTARGLWQCIEAVCQKYYGQLKLDPHTTDVIEQIAAFRLYVQHRYGSPEKALAFHVENGYY